MKTIAVIGAGNVGAHVISYGVARNMAARFLLLDLNEELEEAHVLDVKDSLLFSENSRVQGVDFSSPELSTADIIIITAGAKQSPGETRCDLLDRNVEILKSIASSLPELKPEVVIMLVTNPVDVLTHLAKEIFDLPSSQILGTGTLLDSARLRWRLAERFEVNIANVHGYVLGEHGDSEFVAWSTVTPSDSLNDTDKDALEEEVRQAAYKIIEGKGATYFGIAAASIHLAEAIMNNTREVMPVSASLDGQYGIEGIALGVPAVIGARGVEEVKEIELAEDEQIKLKASADKLRGLYEECPLRL